jgi:hypothetical protein
MGLVIYRRITNVFEIPLDILVETLGRGLHLNRSGQVPLLEPNIGTGLGFEENSSFGVRYGEGLKLDDLGRISVDIGCDMFKDTEPDPSKTVEVEVQIDSHLSLDAQKLSLRKVYRKYTVYKNASGHVIDFLPGETVERIDDVILAVPYGYGTGFMNSSREETPEAPNFYAK